MLELLCFKHYEERKHNETNQETKETTNGSAKSYYEKKEKERKVKCQNITEKQNQLNLL